MSDPTLPMKTVIEEEVIQFDENICSIQLGKGSKKKLEFSNRGGRGSENKKKFPTFPKTVPFYLECHDSARNVIKFFWPYVPPPPPILLLPYIDPYVHGSLPIYSNFNIHHDLK